MYPLFSKADMVKGSVMRERVLVTGANGFVGSNLCRLLIQDNVDVWATGTAVGWRLMQGGWQDRFKECDLTSSEQVSALLQEVRPDVVYHCATYGAYPYRTGVPFQADRTRMISVNLNGTLNLLQAAESSHVRRLVHLGSSSEYGAQTIPRTEDLHEEPTDFYGLTKFFATHACLHAARTGRLSVTVLRLFSVYGPLEEPTRLIPTLLRAVMTRQRPELLDPRPVRDYVYVDDVYRACKTAANTPAADGRIINIGSGQQTSVGDVVRVLNTLSPDITPIWLGERRPEDSPVWGADVHLAKELLGWSPQVSLQEGLRRTLTSAQSNADWGARLLERQE